ncbi:MAG: efflux RND transporter periplasmic adaptor subunit [Bacteroidota bacterium]
MKKIIRITLLVVILGGFAYTIYFLYNKSKKQPVVWETESPRVDNIIKKTVATGTVIPRKEIEIKPHVSGIVEIIYIEPGDKVNEGDLIAKIKIIPDMISLNNAESRLNKAQLQLEDAKLVYERQRKVYLEGVIPEAEFQQYRLGYNNALEELEAAENNLQLIKEGVTKKSGTASNTYIRSTINGMVLDVPVEEGNSVIQANTFNEGTTIASVADMGEMIFEGKVDETEVGKIHQGMPLVLSIGAIEGQTFDAVLEYISPKGVEESGAIQFEIKADVKLQQDVFIRAGYSANADIVLDRRDSVLVIAESLLKFEKESDSVYVEIEKEPQQFEKQYIEVGLSDGLNVEVLSGLSMDAKIKSKEKKDVPAPVDQS